MWIIKNRVQMRPEWPVYCRLVLEAKTDSKSCWTGPPACVGRPCLSSSPPPLPISSSWPYPIFLSNITSLGSNQFSKVWKGSLKDKLTSKFSCHIRAQVIGPCIMVGGSAGASEGVISSWSLLLLRKFFYSLFFLLSLRVAQVCVHYPRNTMFIPVINFGSLCKHLILFISMVDSLHHAFV